MSTTAWGKWFWADWLADSGLRACSAAARGIWMDMLCVAASHEPPGYVAIGGRAMTIEEIARLSGIETAEADRLVSELKTKNVCSRTEDGTLYSRRIIRDHESWIHGHEKGTCEQCGKPYHPRRSDQRYCSHGCRQRAYLDRQTDRQTKRHKAVTSSVTSPVTNVTHNVTDKAEKHQQNQSRDGSPRARGRSSTCQKVSKNLPFSDPDYERQGDPPRASKINAQSPPASGPATALPDGRAGPQPADKASEASKRPHELTKAEFEAQLAAKRKSGAP